MGKYKYAYVVQELGNDGMFRTIDGGVCFTEEGAKKVRKAYKLAAKRVEQFNTKYLNSRLIMKNAETSEKVFERTLSKYVEDIGGMAVKLLSQFLRGLPDRMFLLKGGIVVFVEFKSTGKKPTKIQEYVHKRIQALGFLVLVVDSVETYEKAKNLIDHLIKMQEVYGR